MFTIFNKVDGLKIIERKELEKKKLNSSLKTQKAFHRFGQAKFPDGGSVLGSSQFSILPQLPLKTMLCLNKSGQNCPKIKKLALLI